MGKKKAKKKTAAKKTEETPPVTEPTTEGSEPAADQNPDNETPETDGQVEGCGEAAAPNGDAPAAPAAEAGNADEKPKKKKFDKDAGLSGLAARLDAWLRAYCPEELGDEPTEADVFALSTRLMKHSLDNKGLEAPVPGQTLDAPVNPSKAKTMKEAEKIAEREHGLDLETVVAKAEHPTYFKFVYDGSPGWLTIPKVLK